MKTRDKSRRHKPPAPPSAAVDVLDAPATGPFRLPWWALASALAVSFIAYLPALNGPFVFDDITLASFEQTGNWTHMLGGNRPLFYVMLHFEHRLFGADTFPYHFTNWLLHAAVSLLLLGILRRMAALARLPERAGEIAAAFGAAVFLLHPLNTEAVSYISSRSEVLSLFFGFAAWLLFLQRREQGIGAGVGLAIIGLLALALASKEHAIALIGVLLLTDLLFGGLRRNLRLYLPLALFGAAGGALVFLRASAGGTAGFGTPGVSPLAYLSTQGIVIWRYVGLFFLPWGQSVDHLQPIAATALGFAGLAALTAVAALLWFKAPRIALFGWLAFLVLLGPTSSIVPIADAMAERRVYLAMPGLLLLLLPFLALRMRPSRAWVLAGVLAVLAAVTWHRNGLWNSPELLWRDAIAGNPSNARAHFQLGHNLYTQGRCAEAAASYSRSAETGYSDETLFVDWALALDCDGRPDEALAVVSRAGDASPARWATVGMIEGKRGRSTEALAAIERSLALGPRHDMTWVYRGNVLASIGRREEAIESFRKALSLNPENPAALQGLSAMGPR